MWQNATDDESNTAWHQECVALMKPHITGYYIGETDPVAFPSEATGAFSPESWKRLADPAPTNTTGRRVLRIL